MTYVVIADFEGQTMDEYWPVQQAYTNEPIDGLVAQVPGAGDDGVRVVSIWESKAQHDRFVAERLVPIFQRLRPSGHLTFSDFTAKDLLRGPALAPADPQPPPSVGAPGAAETVLELCNANVASRALHVLAELGTADALGDEPRTAAELAADAGADPDAVGRLLRLLESHGIFASDDAGRWRHTEASRLLRSDHPMSLRDFARISGMPFCWAAVGALDHTVRSGEPGMSVLDPDGFWAYLEAHPDEGAIFQQAMVAKAHGDVAAVLATYDFSRHRRIADIGGGRGHLIAAVLAKHEDVSGVLFDLPHVAAEVAPIPRLNVVAGDFFTDPLPACDAYMLMNIIHDWDDKEAVAILAAVANAGRSSGATVLLVETVMPEGPEPHWAKTLDVVMLAITGGRERTLGEYDALLDAAGLELVTAIPTVTPFSIIEARVR